MLCRTNNRSVSLPHKRRLKQTQPLSGMYDLQCNVSIKQNPPTSAEDNAMRYIPPSPSKASLLPPPAEEKSHSDSSSYQNASRNPASELEPSTTMSLYQTSYPRVRRGGPLLGSDTLAGLETCRGFVLWFQTSFPLRRSRRLEARGDLRFGLCRLAAV